MSHSLVEQVRLVYWSGDPRRALDLADKSLAANAVKLASRDRFDLLVLKSHSLNAIGRWQEALAVLDEASPNELDAEARAALAMHKGYLLGSLARYGECWVLLHQSESAAKSLGNTLLLAEVLWRKGMISIFRSPTIRLV